MAPRQGPRTWWFWTTLGLLGICWLGLVMIESVHARSLGIDFSSTVWRPTEAILEGRSIYPVHPTSLVPHTATTNPPLLPVVALPLRLLPYSAALAVFDTITFLGFGTALWVAGVRDWRIFSLACSSAPVVSGLIFGQVTGLLALGYALAWRHRDRAIVAGSMVGMLVALKLLAWPLFLWLLFTRRARAAGVALGVGLALLLLSWAAVDFRGLTGFPRLLRLSAHSWAPSSYSIEAAGLAGGMSHAAARLLVVVAGSVLCTLAIGAAIRQEDSASFAAAAAAGAYLSPVVHLHYAMWLIVLVALVRPRPAWIWLGVVAFWLSPTEPPRSTWQLFVELGLALGLVLFALLPRQLRTPLDVEPLQPARAT